MSALMVAAVILVLVGGLSFSVEFRLGGAYEGEWHD